MLHNDAIESTARRRDGSQIARSRAPRAQQVLLYARSARTCDLRRTVGGSCAVWMLLGCCLSAVWVLLGCCLGAAW
eukprot:11141536-Lingulodinium_polyedra.AAC.1